MKPQKYFYKLNILLLLMLINISNVLAETIEKNKPNIILIVADDLGYRDVSFNGSLDIAKDSIPGFTVYVVDQNGCSIMQQTITGKTDNLQIGKLKIAKTLLGSVINAVKSVLGSNCKIVYDGEIKHPDSNK